MIDPGSYDAIYQTIVGLMRRSAGVAHILGKDLVDLPAELISVNTLALTTAEGTTYKLNVPTAAAQEAFEWRAEVMIGNRELGLLKHYLLKPDFELVEAYGTKVLPVDDPSELKQFLQQLEIDQKPHFIESADSAFVE